MSLDERLKSVVDQLRGLVDRRQIGGGGLAVALAAGESGAWFVGQAGPGLAAGPDVLWPLASISKVYTAATVMALVERGELTLSRPVHHLLPDFRGEGREAVRLWHLLTHTSGLPYESAQMAARLRDRTPLSAIVDEAYTEPLRFAPGTRIAYSDYGFALAARVAEAAAGVPFPRLMQRLLLEPAGLRQTYFPPTRAEDDRIARVEGALGDGTDGAMYNSTYGRDLAHPAFGVVASAGDLLRFGQIFAEVDRPPGPLPLAPATIRAMTRDQTAGRLNALMVAWETALPQPWGIGWMVRGAVDETGFLGDLLTPGSFGHPGASGCAIFADRQLGATVAFVSNHHLNLDPAAFLSRHAGLVNLVLAALSR